MATPYTPEIFDAMSAYIGDKTGDTSGSESNLTPAGGPSVRPVDTIKLEDIRTVNPATGQPIKIKGTKSVSAPSNVIEAIIAHAKSQGVDPYTALAIALQETEFGRLDENYGSAWSYNPDKNIPATDTVNANASRLAIALKDKLAYAKRLGYDKKGEDYALQAYNGYGKLYPRLSIGGKLQNETYYGIPVTATQPLDMSTNPVYGKTIISLRDQVLRNNPTIVNLVDTTQPFALNSQTLVSK